MTANVVDPFFLAKAGGRAIIAGIVPRLSVESSVEI